MVVAHGVREVARRVQVWLGGRHPPGHISRMSPRDRWTEKLCCQKCGARGEARLSEYAGHRIMSDYGTTVDLLPPGFREVKGPAKQGRNRGHRLRQVRTVLL